MFETVIIDSTDFEQFVQERKRLQREGAYWGYGSTWAKEVKGDDSGRALPTLREVIEGLGSWIASQSEQAYQKNNDSENSTEKELIIEESHRGFTEIMDRILEALKIYDKDKPLQPPSGNSQNPCTLHPYSKIAALLVHLYSMEIGSPPLYVEVMRAARVRDGAVLRVLGPYV